MTSEARLEWLKNRQTGIGGSDVAAILGLSKWKSPLEIYESKTETAEPKEEQSQAAYFGSLLEDVVAREFATRTGMKIQRVNSQLVAGEGSWMIANIDRAIVQNDIAWRVYVYDEQRQAETGRQISTDAILECKTASSFMADHWGPSQEAEIVSSKVVTEHKIPLYYETQVQWYLGVTGCHTCYVAVLLGGQDFRIYEVPRNDAVIKAIQEQCHAFWVNHVFAKVPPEPCTKEEVAKLFPSDNGDMLEADNAIAADIGELRNLAGQIKSLQDQVDIVKDRVCAALGGATGFTIAGEKACTYKTQKRTTLDTTRLKKESPDVYQAYAKTSETRVFRLTA